MNYSSSRDEAFVAELHARTGQDLLRCYQCGNCTAGCPMQPFYDLPAHKIMRLAQAGRRNELIGCSSIWLCVGCGQCSARCPNELDVAGILETLRQMARREGRAPEPRQDAFAQSFLESVRANGRVFEIGFLLRYKLKTGRLFDDAELGPKLMKLGKLNLKPHECRGQAEVEAIFRRFSERGGA